MIKQMASFAEALEFARSFSDDPCFSDPMLQTDEQWQKHLRKAIAEPQWYCVFGVYDDRGIIGLFSFLIEREEAYAEMLVGLSRSEDAYREMLDYLQEQFPAYKVDFVLNPHNLLLQKVLREKQATFETEQYKMVWCKKPEGATHGSQVVIPYSEAYRDGYLSIHTKDVYWTAEKVLEAPDRFHVFVALCGEQVVGYLDVTYGAAENEIDEINDLFVCEPYRKQGYGRSLLYAALAENRLGKLILTVDVDNETALSLYRGAGFVIEECGGSITAHLRLRAWKEER